MAFDDILEPNSSRYEERNALPPKPKPPTSSSKPPIESLLGDVDVGQFAKKLGYFLPTKKKHFRGRSFRFSYINSGELSSYCYAFN